MTVGSRWSLLSSTAAGNGLLRGMGQSRACASAPTPRLMTRNLQSRQCQCETELAAGGTGGSGLWASVPGDERSPRKAINMGIILSVVLLVLFLGGGGYYGYSRYGGSGLGGALGLVLVVLLVLWFFGGLHLQR